MNFFKLNPSQKMITVLEQSRLLLARLNDDADVSIPRATSLLKKDYISFNDELYSVVESMLLVSKKVAEYTELDYEMEPWFLQQLDSAVSHVFLLLSYLDIEDDQKMEIFVREFYAVKELLPAPKSIFAYAPTDGYQTRIS